MTGADETPPPVPGAPAMPTVETSAPVVLAEPAASPGPGVPPVAPPTAHAPAFWASVLAPDERVLWWGGPASAGPRGRLISDVLAPAFFVLIGFLIARNAGGSSVGLIGIGFAALAIWLTVLRRRGRTRSDRHYLLTDQRALIGTPTARGPQVESYPITATTRIRLAGNAVYFGERQLHHRERGVRVEPVGFTGLADASAVHDILRQIQRKAR